MYYIQSSILIQLLFSGISCHLKILYIISLISVKYQIIVDDIKLYIVISIIAIYSDNLVIIG